MEKLTQITGSLSNSVAVLLFGLALLEIFVVSPIISKRVAQTSSPEAGAKLARLISIGAAGLIAVAAYFYFTQPIS